jgi:precorrin-2/cobalt-factor-2 C20-methyltransferase
MLVALGLGPGDSELITVRGVRLLRTADKVFVPGRIAKDIVAPYVEADMLDFPMTDDGGRIHEAMVRNAHAIAPFAQEGTAVLGILGDPSFFSTYGKLCQVLHGLYPEIECRVEPGISSITAFASRMSVAVNSGFEVSDGSEKECLVMLKVRQPLQTIEDLRQKGYREFTLAERMYMDGERIYNGDEIPERCDYMSVLFARR